MRARHPGASSINFGFTVALLIAGSASARPYVSNPTAARPGTVRRGAA